MANGNKGFIKKLVDDDLRKKTINKSLTMEIEEKRKNLGIDSEVNVFIIHRGSHRKKLEGCKEQRYVKNTVAVVGMWKWWMKSTLVLYMK